MQGLCIENALTKLTSLLGLLCLAALMLSNELLIARACLLFIAIRARALQIGPIIRATCCEGNDVVNAVAQRDVAQPLNAYLCYLAEGLFVQDQYTLLLPLVSVASFSCGALCRAIGGFVP
jgi:hypothetical protein